MIRKHRPNELITGALALLLAACSSSNKSGTMDAGVPGNPDASTPGADASTPGGADASTPGRADASTPGGTDASTLPPGDAGFTTSMITGDDGTPIQIVQGPSGPPAVLGCADGRRDGLLDLDLYPKIAACLGTWTGTVSLRAAATGAACGNDIASNAPCHVPADICAAGWHICGTSGAVAEVKQLTVDQCASAGGGRYVTAISHCLTQDTRCVYDTAPDAIYQCFPTGWCSEAVCCGAQCTQTGACPDGVWPGATHIAKGVDQGCGAIDAQRAGGGVLCCK